MYSFFIKTGFLLLFICNAKADTLVLDQLNDTQVQAQIAQEKYALLAIKMAQEAALKFSHGNECQQSCPFGCCDSAAGLTYEGGMFMLLNQQATAASSASFLTAKQSCFTYNKMSNVSKDCAIEAKTIEFTKPNKDWYDFKGNCTASAPKECKLINLLPGGNIFGSAATHCKKNSDSPCANDFYSTYKTNPDGSLSIKTKDKTIKVSADIFKDAKSLTLAGVPFEMAQQLSMMYKNIEPTLKLAPSSSYNAQSANLQSSDIVLEAQIQENINLIKEKQKTEEEFLTKNINGEPLHISSSDIFKIISKRYQKIDSSLLP